MEKGSQSGETEAWPNVAFCTQRKAKSEKTGKIQLRDHSGATGIMSTSVS